VETYRAAVVGCGRIGGFIDNEAGPKPWVVTPFSHAAGYAYVDRTEIVACCDLRPDVMDLFGERYGVQPSHRFADYRKMIEVARPDIVSVATQPEHRAEIAIFAAEHGVRALYCEKAMAASLAEADAMVQAVEANGVAFNMGTNRRWDPGFERMKEVIDSGRIGPLRSIILHGNGPLFNRSSHTFDVAQWLNGDCPAAWVQAHLPRGDEAIDGDVLHEDPESHGIIQFENGVTAYALLTARGSEYEAVCEGGTLASLNNGLEWQFRRGDGLTYVEEPFPEFERRSPTVRLIEDLVQALDTGNPTRGGDRVARANTELIFGFIESHLRGGERVPLPLESSTLRLCRDVRPRQIRAAP
jgi:predicted dehydrogenase